MVPCQWDDPVSCGEDFCSILLSVFTNSFRRDRVHSTVELVASALMPIYRCWNSPTEESANLRSNAHYKIDRREAEDIALVYNRANSSRRCRSLDQSISHVMNESK